MDIKTFEAFAGYGSQLMALKRLEHDYPEIHFEPIGISEIDENPIKAYNAVHGDVTNYGDISKIDWNEVEDFDLFTYSFPCTDISGAGLMQGLSEGSGTRSSLLWECKRAIETKKPKYLLMENVKNLFNKTFMPDFQKWLDWLEGQGYNNYCKVLDARDYGIPQHRERAFCVSIRKDCNEIYTFPEKMTLNLCINDFLECPYDETTFYNENYLSNYHEYALKDKRYSYHDIIKVGNVFPSNHQSGVVHSIYGSSSTIMLHHGTGVLVEINGRIKKLSTREMFRLMGCLDNDIDKMLNAVGKTGCMKLSGNSIVVDVLYYIFKSMFVK